jgi:hypothetical protein
MPTLKSTKSEYEFTLGEMKLLIAKELNVEARFVHVNYVMKSVDDDGLYSAGTKKEVSKIQVYVEENKT